MKLFAILSLGLSASLLGCASDPSSADADSDDTAQVDEPEVAAASLAVERGISVGEATVRLAWQDKLDDLEAAIQADDKLAAAFSAVWVDPDHGDRVVVAMTDPAAAADVMTIAQRLGIDAGTDVVTAQRSRAQLQQIADELGALTGGQGAGTDISIDPVANVVAVSVPPDATALRATVAAAAQRYGAAVEIRDPVVATPAATSFDPPMRGGVKMFSTSDTAITYCTTGFFARTTGLPHSPYIVTAGHCVTEAGNSGAWSAKFANGRTHALTNGGLFKVNIAGDMSALKMVNVSTWKPHPWIVVQDGPSTTYRPRYTIAGTAASHVGMHVCHTGITSGTHCGTIQKLHVHVYYNKSRTVGAGDQVQVSMCSKSGDSGGPVFASHRALGTLSATTGCVSYYQPIGPVEDQLDVEIAHCVAAGGKTDDTGNCCSLKAVYNDTPPNDFTCK